MRLTISCVACLLTLLVTPAAAQSDFEGRPARPVSSPPTRKIPHRVDLNADYVVPKNLYANRAQVPLSGESQAALKPLDDLLRDMLHEHNVPGMSLAVTRNGQLVYNRGAGFADIAQQQVVKPETQFRIASLSKPLTAVAILRLVQHKRLKLDDLVVDHLPLAGDKTERELRRVTIRQLLQHRGGYDRAASFDPMFAYKQLLSPRGMKPDFAREGFVYKMSQRPLDFTPDTKYAYSNYGYCLLGRVIESVTQQPYDSYVREAVLNPLKMTQTRLGKSIAAWPDEARYYTRNKVLKDSVAPEAIKGLVPQQYGGWNLEIMDSHGGWVSTASDMAKFAAAFHDVENPQLLTKPLVREMFAFHPAEKEKAVAYGMGWQVRRIQPDNASDTRINSWHTGALTATSTLLVRRHDGFTWAVMFNTRYGKDKKTLAGIIDPLVHKAVNRIKTWPAK